MQSQTITYTPVPIVPKFELYEVQDGIFKKVARIVISGEDYSKCHEYSSKQWTNKKRGYYGKGMLNTTDDPRKTERIGFLGQMAVTKMLKGSLDFTYRAGGDGGVDLIVFEGTKADVKTANRNYGAVLIYTINEYGKIVVKNTDIYIGAFAKEDDLKNQLATIVVVGYIGKDYVDTLPVVPARKGNHQNREVPYSKLIEFS